MVRLGKGVAPENLLLEYVDMNNVSHTINSFALTTKHEAGVDVGVWTIPQPLGIIQFCNCLYTLASWNSSKKRFLDIVTFT